MTRDPLLDAELLAVPGVSTPIPLLVRDTLVVGAGSAAYCLTDRLAMAGEDRVLMVTDARRAGTSRNAGSDKQTYYKLTLGGAAPDSVRDLAETLFAGGAMDGDHALVEAALSATCFLHLCDAGVDFPRDDFGQFVGYKTDHDPRQRATSVGPYTSRSMTERLEARVRAAGVPVLEGFRLVDLVVEGGRVLGALLLHKAATGPRLVLVKARQVVQATGGPALIHADSVYPHGQWGATGAALRAGLHGKNLTEWQFGLASLAPRWNVSGSYMQVVPRFVSTGPDGEDPRDFLSEAIPDPTTLNTLVFLKGYQWPFDARKAHRGSSVIDLLVHRETRLGRRVWLDFRSNPRGGFGPETLGEEAREYLSRAGVLDLPPGSTPVERLQVLNRPALDFYLERNPGIDLAEQPLEIGVCAQHNNGGIEVDAWWRGRLEGYFAIGETAGTHGVHRPGGAALNSGQVGATRAAQWIAQQPQPEVSTDAFGRAASEVVVEASRLMAAAATRHASGTPDNCGELLERASRRMSDAAGLVRSHQGVSDALAATRTALAGLGESASANPRSRRSVDRLFLAREQLTTQLVHLAAMLDYLDHGGRSRGSVVYTDPEGALPDAALGGELLGEAYRFRLDGGALDGEVQTASFDAATGEASFTWRERRPLPEPNDNFETVWKAHRSATS